MEQTATRLIPAEIRALLSKVVYGGPKPKGESLFLYTDGLTEARDGSDGEYGAERLLRIVQEGSTLPPSGLIETCMQSVAAFQAGVPSSDDVTVMAMRYV